MSRVRFHVEREQRIGREGLGFTGDDPKHHEAVPVPGREAALEEGPGDWGTLVNFGDT